MGTPEKGERWGILGGTFDPVHRGHLNLAYAIYFKKKLNGIILIPTFNHPVKKQQAYAPYKDRLEMLRLASSKKDIYFISEIEKEKNLSGYSIDTIKALKSSFPDTELFFIIGADNIEQIDNWYHPEEIVKEVKVVAGSRTGFALDSNSSKYIGNIEYIKTPLVNISSTEIRTMIKRKDFERLKGFVDNNVLNYIIDKNLYL